jgi:hypothetical protein
VIDVDGIIETNRYKRDEDVVVVVVVVVVGVVVGVVDQSFHYLKEK